MPRRRSRRDGGPAVGPGAGLLQLRRQPKQCAFTAISGYEMHAHGQIVGGPVQGHGHGRLPGAIGDGGETGIFPQVGEEFVPAPASQLKLPKGTGGCANVGVKVRS